MTGYRRCWTYPKRSGAAAKVKKGESSRFIKGMGKVGERVKILLNEYQLLFDFDKGEDSNG